MDGWTFAEDHNVAVFYNATADIYIQLWLKLSLNVYYCLGQGLRCRKLNWNLSTDNDSLTIGGEKLLSQLKSSKGASAHQNNCCGVWAFEPEGSTIVFTIKGRPTDKLVLVDDGFFYFCDNGALVGQRNTETCMSSAKARKMLGIKLASKSAVPRPSPKVLSQQRQISFRIFPDFRLGLTSLSELQSISDLLDQIGMKGEHKKKALNRFDQHLVALEQIMTNITDQVTGVANPYLLGGRIVRTASEPHVSYSICFYVALDFRFVEWWTDNQVQNIAGSV